MVAMDGRDPGSWRRVRDRGAHRRMYKENISPEPLAREMRGADFQEFLQPASFEDWNFKGLRVWLGQNPEGAALLLERRLGNNPGGRWHNLRDIWDTQGENIPSYWRMSLRGRVHGDAFQDKGAGGYCLPPLSLSINDAETPA